MEREDFTGDKRKRFYPTISLGSIIATLIFIASGIGIYTQVIADINKAKSEIENIKADNVRKDQFDRDVRLETKEEIKEIKRDIKDMKTNIQQILIELQKRETSKRS